MPCRRAALMKDPGTVGALLVAPTVAAGAAFLLLGPTRGALVLLACTAAAWWNLAVPWTVRRLLRRCVEMQRALLAESRVDVVVGSSFGGAVAVELLARRHWSGPTVLLCPAHEKVAKLAALRVPALGHASGTVVVHGLNDKTVPVAHARSLVRTAPKNSALLVEVDDNHRLSASTNAQNFATWIQQARDLHHQQQHQ